MKVLITGGEGFIGQNLQIVFQKHGIDYVSLDVDLAPKSFRLKPELANNKAVWGDITNRLLSTSNLLAIRDVTHIIHLAAVTGIQTSLADPWETWRVNIGGTINVLELARSLTVKKVILVSSVAAGWPMHPYAVSKRAMELAGQSYQQTYGLDVVSFRFPNLFGPHSHHKMTVVANFARDILLNEPLNVHGDGSQTRQFLYAPDVCEFMIDILTSNIQDGPAAGSICQLAGYYQTIDQLAGRMLRLASSQAGLKYQSDFPRFELPAMPVIGDDVGVWSREDWLDESRFDQTLLSTVNWFRSQLREDNDK